jgi:hypothetical protein
MNQRKGMMREIGKLYRVKGQLLRGGHGICLRHAGNGALWSLNMKDDVSNLLGRHVRVEGFLSATETIDVFLIDELADTDSA